MDGTDLAIDIISDMPDPLLTQILSLLTTKEAVRTCILSKRWTDLWTSTDTLDFDFGSWGFDRENRFLQFLNGVLNRRGFSPLDKFKLRWHSYKKRSNHGIVEECISNAVTCRPRLIYIYIRNNPIFKLPDSLLNCASVKEMSLVVGYSLFKSQPKSIDLPSLQKLEIGDISIDDDLIEMFLLGCPVLEELALTHCQLMFKEINSNVLKKLTIKKCLLRTTSFTLKNASSLVTVDLDKFSAYYELNLLGGLPNVTSLRINESHNVLGLLNEDIPNCLILNNLKSLELGVLERRYDWDLLVCFLQHSPNLKKLVLNCHGLLKRDIPNCLILNNLKSLELGVLETTYDWDLLVWFLQHSPNLKKLVLNCHRVDSLCKKHYRENSFPCEFLEMVEIRIVETWPWHKKETDKLVRTTLGMLVKTIGEIVTL